MNRPTIFLNELSLSVDRDLDQQELLPYVLATLKTANEAKKIRHDLIVVGSLTEIAFGLGQVTLQSLLRGADYRDQWRSVKLLEQSSPYDPEDWVIPSELEEVRFEGQSGVAMLRAVTNKSAILSFALVEPWGLPRLVAQHLTVGDAIGEVLADIEVNNLADPRHIAEHSEFLRGVGADLSSSSIIFENEEFVLRMYFNDHDPPHFHVMEQHRPSVTIARFRIDTLDQLSQSSSLRPGLRRQITIWAENRKEALRACWNDCRLHRHPARMD
jgi:hypothetical protein